MIRNKKSRRTLEDIGKRWYGFDLKVEKKIYNYVCCVRIKRIGFSVLDEKLKFVSYHQWSQYVRNKYEFFDKDKLIEFSRYLNQRIRNIKPSHEYWSIMASIVMTLTVTKLVEGILSMRMDFKDIPFWGTIVVLLFFEIFIVVSLLFIINQTLHPILDNNLEENLLRDYKEIIDEMINNMETLTRHQV